MIKTNPLSIIEIKQLASKTREKYGIKKDTYFPILEIIDKLCSDEQLTYQLVEDDSPLLKDGEVAVYNAKENFIYIKESVIQEIEEGIWRSNFTLAHEFFHYLQAQVLKFDFKDVYKCKSFEDTEWQANEFAGQLLLPEEYLDLGDDELASKFHVSLECVLTRKAKYKSRTDYSYNLNQSIFDYIDIEYGPGTWGKYIQKLTIDVNSIKYQIKYLKVYKDKNTKDIKWELDYKENIEYIRSYNKLVDKLIPLIFDKRGEGEFAYDLPGLFIKMGKYDINAKMISNAYDSDINPVCSDIIDSLRYFVSKWIKYSDVKMPEFLEE